MKLGFSRKLTTAVILICCVGLILLLYRVPKQLQLGEPIPNFSLQTESGEKRHLSDQAGQLILVHFWASWCGPCLFEFPALEKLHQQFQNEGLTLLAINSDLGTFEEAKKQASEFLKKVPVTFPVLYDFQGEITALYGVYQLPVTYIVGRDGNLKAIESGPHDWTDKEHQEMIQNFLQ